MPHLASGLNICIPIPYSAPDHHTGRQRPQITLLTHAQIILSASPFNTLNCNELYIFINKSGAKWLQVVCFGGKFTSRIMDTMAYSFIGDFESRADAKNRVVLPAAFKREFEGQEVVRLVIRKDMYEDCLVIYPYDVWQSMMSDLRQRLNPYNRAHAQFLREWQSGTAEAQLDGNGRLLVPQRLLDVIHAAKDFVLLGVDNHIELWDKQKRAETSLSGEQLGELAGQLFNA